MGSRHLATYLNDHLALAVALIELAKRTRASNRGSELGACLERLGAALENEKELLKDLLARLEARESTVKQLAGWAAEKLGRLKLNDALLSYSALSRVVELESLIAGLEGQIGMWAALRRLGDAHPALAGIPFDRTIAAAEALQAELKAHHQSAARAAFGR